jgi:hypothetical protein
MRPNLGIFLLLYTAAETFLYVKADDNGAGGSVDAVTVESKPSLDQQRHQEGQWYRSFWQLNDLNESQVSLCIE